MCWESFRQEFRWSNFGFHYEQPQDFAHWSWQSGSDRVSGYFVTYRLLLAALFISILVSYGSLTEKPDYFFIYFTNIGFIIQTLHLMVAAALPIQFILQSDKKGTTRWTLFNKFGWFLSNAMNLLTIVITTVYWAAIYEPGVPLSARDFLVHAVNSIVSVTDLLLSKRPCRLLHLYHPLVLLLAYTAFSAIFWAAGGRNEDGLSYIYAVLNWENLGLSVPFVVGGCLVALPIVQLLLWSLHLLRDRCWAGRHPSSHQYATDQGWLNSGFDGL